MNSSYFLLNLGISILGSLIASLILEALKRHQQP
jgi:uncharacterized membrane protein